MQNISFLLLFSAVLICSCNVSIQRNSTEKTETTGSADDFPDVSAAIAAGDFKLLIKDAEGSKLFPKANLIMDLTPTPSVLRTYHYK